MSMCNKSAKIIANFNMFKAKTNFNLGQNLCNKCHTIQYNYPLLPYDNNETGKFVSLPQKVHFTTFPITILFVINAPEAGPRGNQALARNHHAHHFDG